MFEQKLYKNGSSVVVTVPKQLLKKHNLRDGSGVVLEEERGKITITSKKKKTAVGVTPKFVRMVDEFAREHEDVLQALNPEFSDWLDDITRDESKLISELAKTFEAVRHPKAKWNRKKLKKGRRN